MTLNDIDPDLVNFWAQCINNVEALEEQCDSLPYSEQLYYEYHHSLFDGTELEPLERAVRWFYVLLGSSNGYPSPTLAEWRCGIMGKGYTPAHAYRDTIKLFRSARERFRNIQIDNEVARLFLEHLGVQL